MTEQPEKKCNIDDLLCQMQVLNHLEGMKNLIGTEKFQEKYPDFKELADVVRERMGEQRGTIKEIMERCGLDTGEFKKEEGLTEKVESPETTVEEE